METLSNRNLAEEYILLCYALNRKMEHTMRYKKNLIITFALTNFTHP